MAKGWWFNLILLVVVLAGSGGLWWADQQEEARKKAEEASRRVSDIPKESVTQISFVGGDHHPLTMAKKEGKWVMTSPQGAAVDTKGVDSLLGVLAAIYERKVADKDDDPKAFGFDAPVATLTITGQDGKSLVLTAGGASPASGNRYLRVGDKGMVVMLTGDKASPLLQESKELRERSLFPGVEQDQVNRIQMDRSSQSLTVAKSESDKWRLTNPVSDRAHPQRLTAWIAGMLMTNASGFKPATPPATADWTITLEANKVSHKLTLWRDKDELLAQRQGEPDAMVISKHMVTDLDKTPLELADLRALDAPEISHLEATWQGKTLTVDKKEKNWPIPAWNSVEESLTRDAVEALTAVGSPPAPELTLTATHNDSRWQVTLWKEGKDFLMSVPDRPLRLRLSTLQSEALEKSLQVIFAPPEAKKEDKKSEETATNK